MLSYISVVWIAFAQLPTLHAIHSRSKVKGKSMPIFVPVVSDDQYLEAFRWPVFLLRSFSFHTATSEYGEQRERASIIVRGNNDIGWIAHGASHRSNAFLLRWNWLHLSHIMCCVCTFRFFLGFCSVVDLARAMARVPSLSRRSIVVFAALFFERFYWWLLFHVLLLALCFVCVFSIVPSLLILCLRLQRAHVLICSFLCCSNSNFVSVLVVFGLQHHNGTFFSVNIPLRLPLLRFILSFFLDIHRAIISVHWSYLPFFTMHQVEHIQYANHKIDIIIPCFFSLFQQTCPICHW